jgi:hypothetical protein
LMGPHQIGGIGLRAAVEGTGILPLVARRGSLTSPAVAHRLAIGTWTA